MSDTPKRNPDEATPVEPAQTLTEADMTTGRAVDRRSMMSVLGAAAAAGAAGTVLNGCFATAPGPAYGPQPGYGQRQCTGMSDSDNGPGSDPANCGRGGARPTYVAPGRQCTGVSDSDGGPGSDPANCGRAGGPVYVQPAQPGYGQPAYVQPAVQGGITDGDNGRNSDRPGWGRGAPNRMQTGATDGDGGRYSDQVGWGRGMPRR